MGNSTKNKGFGVDWPNGKPDGNDEPLDLIWPRDQRESDIIKQQNNLHDYFHWYEAGIGFAVSSLLWGVCLHLWGG